MKSKTQIQYYLKIYNLLKHDLVEAMFQNTLLKMISDNKTIK